MMKEPEIVAEIKDRLRRCQNAAEVNETADLYRSKVEELKNDNDTRVFAIHISNLKAMRLSEFRSQ